MITTLCYLEKDNKYLMLHRTKKENDINNSIYLSEKGVVLQSKESWEFEIPNAKQIKITNISDRDIRFEAQVTGE